MSATSEAARVLEANARFVARFDRGDAALPPSRSLAILTCIDARIDPSKAFGLEIGDAHVVRNAGGRASDDAIRSLLVSTWLLGPREIMVVHHEDCGMLTFTDDVLQGLIRDKTGQDRSATHFLTFKDLDGSVRDDVAKIREEAAFPGDVRVSGWIYDVRTGALREVS